MLSAEILNRAQLFFDGPIHLLLMVVIIRQGTVNLAQREVRVLALDLIGCRARPDAFDTHDWTCGGRGWATTQVYPAREAAKPSLILCRLCKPGTRTSRRKSKESVRGTIGSRPNRSRDGIFRRGSGDTMGSGDTRFRAGSGELGECSECGCLSLLLSVCRSFFVAQRSAAGCSPRAINFALLPLTRMRSSLAVTLPWLEWLDANSHKFGSTTWNVQSNNRVPRSLIRIASGT
jgi:hypothetical protein